MLVDYCWPSQITRPQPPHLSTLIPAYFDSLFIITFICIFNWSFPTLYAVYPLTPCYNFFLLICLAWLLTLQSVSIVLLTLLPFFAPFLSVVWLYRCNSRCLVVQTIFCMVDTHFAFFFGFAVFHLLTTILLPVKSCQIGLKESYVGQSRHLWFARVDLESWRVEVRNRWV